MTPYELKVLLHYYAQIEDHPDIERDPPIWRPTIDAFLADGLLRLRSESGDEIREGHYVLGERGYAFCQALQRVPLPVQRWVMPEFGSATGDFPSSEKG